MPRNVRNFWIEGIIEGRESPLTGGPRSKNGNFYLDIFIRDKGRVNHALYISGSVSCDGSKLTLSVKDKNKEKVIYTKEVTR